MNADDYFRLHQQTEFIHKLNDCIYQLSMLYHMFEELIEKANHIGENISLNINSIDIGREIAKRIK